MRTFSWSSALFGLSLVGVLAMGSQACGDKNTDDNNGGSGGSSNGGKGGSASGSVTYEKDAKPIFEAKCGSCHAKGKSSAIFHTLATDYSSAQRDSGYCEDPATKGDCTIVRIKDGTMPQGAGCKGNPEMDKNNDKCLTKEQQDIIQAWVDGGLKEK